MTRPIAQVLPDLVVLAEELVTRPAVFGSASVFDRSRKLAREVRELRDQPAENVRLTHAAEAVVTAVEARMYWQEVPRADDDAGRPVLWLVLIGSLLPLLRADAYTAFCLEKEQMRS